eukprot:XP_027311711.1 vegetative cell wall protein gp1-like isoform X1 [Anas platyrhynchos]
MVSREPLPGPAPASEGGQEKAMTVRSVLLNRDSPDIESRLQRRRNRTQQVRFKDLVEGSAEQAGSPPPGPAAAPGPNTPRASPPPRDAPEPAALCASRRSWPQAQPCSLTLPMPRKACASAAIQTSPSLQKPFPASQPRSKSVCDMAGVVGLPTALGSARCPGGPSPTPSVRAVPPHVPGSLPAHERAATLTQRAAACHASPPPPRDPCPPYPGTAGCPAASCTSPAKSCPPEPCARLCGNPRGSRRPSQRPASVPCGQPPLPAEVQGLGRSDSEHSLPRGRLLPQPSPHCQQTLPTAHIQGLRQPAQGTPPGTPHHPSTSSAARHGGGPAAPRQPPSYQRRAGTAQPPHRRRHQLRLAVWTPVTASAVGCGPPIPGTARRDQRDTGSCCPRPCRAPAPGLSWAGGRQRPPSTGSPASPPSSRRRCATSRTFCNWWSQPRGQRQRRRGTSTPEHLRDRALRGRRGTCSPSCSRWKGCWRPANKPSECCWTSSRTWRRRRPSGTGDTRTGQGRTLPTAGPAGTAPASSTAWSTTFGSRRAASSGC